MKPVTNKSDFLLFFVSMVIFVGVPIFAYALDWNQFQQELQVVQQNINRMPTGTEKADIQRLVDHWNAKNYEGKDRNSQETLKSRLIAWDQLGPEGQQQLLNTIKGFGAPTAKERSAARAKAVSDDPSSQNCIPLIGFSFTRCFWAPLLGALGGTIMFLGGSVLWFASSLFDTLVYYIVVAFGSTIKTLGVIEGIHTAWTVFRDMSNIIIIGMFTFIAISIIIGNHTFGEKKLVARVLVVAILINFSLLFAKITIDSSNFIAWQIYRKMGPSESSAVGGHISSKFMSIIGITSVWDSFGASITQGQNAVDASARTGGGTFSGLGQAFKGFFYGVFGGTLLFVAAGVLLYGSFLIAARSVLLIFLMLVSALAFASYLVPGLSQGEYGWKTWWKSLINASVFAPLLMLLLYASLVIITPAMAVRQGTLAAVGAPSTSNSGTDWTVILTFIMGVGMLYVSFKVANSFSSKIAGFSVASMVAATPIVGASRLTGLMGRSVAGRVSNTRFGKWGQALTDKMHDNPNYRPTWREAAGLKTFNSLRKGTLDPLNSRLGKQAGKLMNAPGIGEDWGKGGYVGVKKRQAEHAVHLAEDLAEGADAAAARKSGEAANRIREKISKQIAELTKTVDKGTADTLKQSAEDRDIIHNEMQKLVKESSTGEVQRGSSGAIRPTEEQNRNAAAERARSAMKGEAVKIAQAATEASHKAAESLGINTPGATDSHDDLDTSIKSLSKEALEEALKNINSKNYSALPKELRDHIGHAGHAGHEAAHAVAKSFAQYSTSWTPGELLPGVLKDTNARAGIEKAFKDHSDQEAVKKLMKGLGQNPQQAAKAVASHAANAPAAHPPTTTAHPPGDDHGHG